MQEIIKYQCGFCQKEFSTKHSCKRHENTCDSSINKLKNIIEQTIKKFENLKIHYMLNPQLKTFSIYVELNNGNRFEINNKTISLESILEEGDYLYEDMCEEIENRGKTYFQGEIQELFSDGYSEGYYIGGDSLEFVGDVLNGRKVKIEVIE